MSGLVALATGLAFALGLGIGGMTRPAKVLSFLDVTGAWDPTLAFVMGGAVTTYALARLAIERRGRPLLRARFSLPSRRDVDAPLIAGAALFGAGWGLVGLCPGPALVTLGAAVPESALFVAAMTAGMLLYDPWRTLMTLHRLTDRLAVSGALSARDVRELRARGFRTVIDLRSDGEPRPQGIPPWEEATIARDAGLEYHQIPVEPPALCDNLALTVRRAVAAAPAPVVLHCTTGRRAGTFGLALLACEEPIDVDDCFARGRAMGLDFDGMPRLTAFLRQFVGRHGLRAVAGDAAAMQRATPHG